MTALLIGSRAELATALRPARRQEQRIGLVPTMGALHPGHLSLIERARSETEVVVVSVFVNPTQFTDPEDFTHYPRDLDADLALASEAGADIVFAPGVSDLYPAPAPEITIDPGPLGDLLEGAFRPGHFRGVATVVAKLLVAVAPDVAYFGEKDYQQLLLIRRLVQALLLHVEIVAGRTVREADGLALSSRNVRLSTDERRAATVLSRALVAGASALSTGADARTAETAMVALVAAEPLAALDYAVVRDAASLEEAGEGPLRLLIAARVGPVRLIDNAAADAPPIVG